MKHKWWKFLTIGCSAVLLASSVLAHEITLKDPSGDDNGPGQYTYPTDGVYKRGSFDLTALNVKTSAKKADFTVSLNSNLEDPWSMGGGFAVQMVFIFIDTDGKEGSGFTKAPSGLNVEFDPAGAWDRLVILSPQGPGRVKNEIETKAGEMGKAIVVPSKTRGSGRAISGSVDLAELGTDDPGAIENWGYQVVVQSNEGFPSGSDLLTRKVNEYEGQHRFGGGNDGDCDPHAMDILAGAAKGDKGEIDAQHAMLAYECNEDGTAKKTAVLTMVKPSK
jgi:carbohydrate-binding DOMON domain-containing protein